MRRDAGTGSPAPGVRSCANVLFIRSGGLGDLVLALPVLSLLRESMPDARVFYAGKAEFGKLARTAGLVDGVLSEDRPEIVSLFSKQAGAGDQLRSVVGPLWLAVSCVSSEDVRRNLLAAGAAEVVSIAPNPPPWSSLEAPPPCDRLRRSCQGRLRNRRGVPYRRADHEVPHAADHLLSALAARFDVPGRAVPRLPVPRALRERARRILRERGLEPARFLALHPGSGSPRKNWPVERFGELARRAREELSLRVAVISGPAEATTPNRDGQLVLRSELLRRIADRHDGSGLSCISCASLFDAVVESPPLAVLAGVLAECAVYVGNDSGVTHLAAACGAPTIAVFGPTDPAVWGPRGEGVRIMRDPSGELASVAVDDVLAAVRDLVR